LNRDINAFDARVRSQNGEDGIIKEILFRIGFESRYAAEFGVESGLECNSAHLLLDYDWSGLLIEGNPEFAAAAKRHYSGRRVVVHNAYVDVDNIAAIFRDHAVPRSLDLLSIDVDGNDYWMWKALGWYRPRVVVIEYNATFAPPQRWVMEYNAAHRWRGDTYFGASLSSLAALGMQLGYALLGTDLNGVNAFFIRRDLLALSGFPERDAERAWHRLYVDHPFGSGPALEL
jgi:hypothetical protein